MSTLARSERIDLSNTALETGPTAATLCGDWTVHDLVAHLLIRERDPLGAPGILVPQLEFLNARATRRLARQDFTTLVERFRSGPPPWSPFAVPPFDRLGNTIEFFVHHEDIRRAGTQWSPRVLPAGHQDELWKAIGLMGRGLVRRTGVPVVLRRTDTGANAVLRKGNGPVTVAGLPGELVLYLYGRGPTDDVELEGPPEAVGRLEAAELGF